MPRKPGSLAAHPLSGEQRSGQVPLTPCPHCGKLFPRLDSISHAVSRPSRPDIAGIVRQVREANAPAPEPESRRNQELATLAKAIDQDKIAPDMTVVMIAPFAG